MRTQSLTRSTIVQAIMMALAVAIPLGIHAQGPCGTSNADIVRGLISAYNRKDLDALLSCYADTVKIYVPGRETPQTYERAALRVTYASIFKASPDEHIDQLASRDSGALITSDERLTHGAGRVTESRARYHLTAGRIDAQWVGLERDDSRVAPLAADTGADADRPRSLTNRTLDNLQAFARLVSVVRYFHPTEGVLLADWDRFTARGVRRVEMAETSRELAGALREMFSAVAPTVQVFETSHPIMWSPPPKPADSLHAAIAFWEHRGVSVPTPPNVSDNNVYASTLRVVPTPTGKLPAAAPSPDVPYEIRLNGGVSARVPLSLWTAVSSMASEQSRTPTFPWRAGRPARLDRAMRLTGVIDIWGVMQHFYPYHEVAHTDWPAALRAALRTAATDSNPAMYERTLNRLVSALHDGHGSVSAPFSRVGILPLVFAQVEGQTVVTHVANGAGSGIARGDVVLRYNGQPMMDVIAERLSLVSAATTQWGLYRVMSGLALVPAGDTITLQVHAGAVHRAPVRTVRVVSRIIRGVADLPSEPRPPVLQWLRPTVAYLDLNALTDSAFTKNVDTLQTARAIIFDMRGYPRMNTPMLLSHLTDSVVYSAHFEVPTFRQPDRVGVTFADGAWTVMPSRPRLKARLVFITDGRAISYAESTMGIVESYRLGDIVGEPTAGTNGNVNPFVIPGGYQIQWTGMQVRKRDGSPHHGVGILPTVLMHRTIKGVCDGRDELLERALKLVEPRP